MEEQRVAAIDPGTVNAAAWIGSYNPETKKVRTFELVLGNPTGEGKKTSASEFAAGVAVWVADKCKEHQVKHALVETAPQWNIPARICAASTYGVLVGCGDFDMVKFSGPKTKQTAIQTFAENLGMTGELETPGPELLQDKDKKTLAKIRLINKRNAVRVVKKLLEFSNDEKGLEVLKENKKLDDLSDAILLACGMVFTTLLKDKKKPTKKRKAEKPLEAYYQVGNRVILDE